jgi:hypothetical protein
MSTLKMQDKVIFERLFNRGGYVLDFSDARFSEFFREYGVNITEEKYYKSGTSKMNRLRAFWEIEPDCLVSNVLEGLLQYACNVKDVEESDKNKAFNIIERLQGKLVTQEQKFSPEDKFLQREFVEINTACLGIDQVMQGVINQRLDEIKKALKHEAPLSVIFLCGSILEGLLLDAALNKPQLFNTAHSAPKSPAGKVLSFHQWKLEALINVAHEVDILSLDVKKHGHALRDFRNYIHPREQIANKFNPDMHTARISWQVLRAAIANLSGQR